MDLKYSKEDEDFRVMVREWVTENLPENFRTSADTGAVSSRGARLPWYQSLAKKGWLCVSWPKEYGGPGWTLAQQAIFNEEASIQGAPGPDMGVYMVGPMLIEFATDEQKKRYLPPIAAAEEFWCQGYSEPNAGSDLANLALRAEDRDDNYILNGQKIWTSGANEAEMIFILVRTETSGKKQRGISFVVAPMDTEGIRITPIKQITDESHFYETFFTDTKVPKENLIGRENEGWTIAKRLLAHERVGLGAARTFQNSLNKLIELAKRANTNGSTKIEDPVIRQKVAKLSMELDALRATDYRGLTQMLHGSMPGPESSIIKLFGSEIFQGICELALEIQGPAAQLWADENLRDLEQNWSKTAMMSRSYSIFSGTSEIQRNIISERVLGMPRGN